MVRMNFDPASCNIAQCLMLSRSIFNVYPNPSNGVFTIELDATEKHDITVNNALGQTVYFINY